MPLRQAGMSRVKAFTLGMLSGAVEPLGALLTIGLAAVFAPMMPVMLSFAAGAMLYVVVEELVRRWRRARTPMSARCCSPSDFR